MAAALVVLFVVFLGISLLFVGAQMPTQNTVYVLAYSWQPEFCFGQSSYVGCATPSDFWRSHFTLHGLWPQYTTSGYPSNCGSAPLLPDVLKVTIGMETMTQYWPNVKNAEGTADYFSFYQHEWSKHGTCSGLTQPQYFNATIGLIKTFGTPEIVSNNVSSMWGR